MNDSLLSASPQTNSKKEERWCPDNMKHSHIGAFIDYFQDIVEIKKECYIPLIKEWGRGLCEIDSKLKKPLFPNKVIIEKKNNIPNIKERDNGLNEIDNKLKKLLTKVEICRREKFSKNLPVVSLEKLELEQAKQELEQAKQELEQAKQELKEAEQKLEKFCSDNFYRLLECVFENKNNIESVVKVFILRLFNHFSISILKAEYSLFDNYSDILGKITGFECDSEESFKIKYLYDNDRVKKDDARCHLSQYTDQYLIKSIINSIWYLIEICKTIDHKININKFDAFFQVVNKNRKQRLNTIHPISGEKELINKEIVDLFELSLESILDLTLIDHYFCFTKDNFDKLFTANERINSLHSILDPEKTDNPKEEDYNFEDTLNSNNKGNLFADFQTVKNVVEIKSKLLLRQLKKSFDSKLINNKKFNDQFDFLFYGIKNKDYAENFDEYINKSECFNFEDLEEAEARGENLDKYTGYNLCTKVYIDIVAKKRKIEDVNIENVDFSFLKDYNKEQLKKCKKCEGCDIREEDKNKKHCPEGKSNTKKDILDFNNCSKISVDNFLKNNSIIDKIKKVKDYENLIKDNNEINGFLQDIKSTLFKDNLEGFDNKTLKRLRLNPTNLTYFIDFLKSVLDALLKDLEKEEQYDDFQNKLSKINDIYTEYYKFLIDEFNLYIRVKENTDYTTGELRFFPPFQHCFYKLENNQLQSFPRTEKDFIDKNNVEPNDNFFFFLSAGLHPVNVFQLSEKNKQYQNDLSYIENLIGALKAQKNLIELSKKHIKVIDNTKKEFEATFEATKAQNVTVLGILGSFIAFVSFATGTLKAVDTVAEFVVFAFVFCVAVAFFGIIIRPKPNSDETEKKWKYGIKWIIGILASLVLITCLVVFCRKEFQDKDVKKTIIEKETIRTKENTISEKQTIEKQKNDTVFYPSFFYNGNK